MIKEKLKISPTYFKSDNLLIKVLAANIYIALVFGLILFDKNLGRDAFRQAGLLLLFLPFLKVDYPKNILLYAVFGFMFSNSATLSNIFSEYVDDWWGGITGIYHWIIILPAYFIIKASNANHIKLFYILFIASVVALYPALSDLLTGNRRYQGFHGQPIPWGNLCLLTGILLFTFNFSKFDRYKSMYWLLPVFGLLFGIFCSLISESRGGWLLFITALPFIFYNSLLQLSRKSQVLSLLTLIVLVCVIFYSPYFNVTERIGTAKSEVAAYYKGEDGSSTSSIGSRFEFWKSSVRALEENPFMGIGSFGFNSWINQDDKFRGELRHKGPHNFFFSLLLMGLPATIFFLFMMAIYCHTTMFNIPVTENAKLTRRLSVILLLAFIEFGLTSGAWVNRLCSGYFIFLSTYLMFLQSVERKKFTSIE